MPMRRFPGATLVEILVTVSVCALISGVLISIYIAAVRVWYRSSSQAQASPPAYRIVDQVNQELKNAYKVAVLQSAFIEEDDPNIGDIITFSLPKKDENGYNLVPMQTAKVISYYRSDESGSEAKTGKVLWRKQVNPKTGSKRLTRVADHVEEWAFEREGLKNAAGEETGRTLAVYAMTLTVKGQEGATVRNSSFQSTVAIRNPDE